MYSAHEIKILYIEESLSYITHILLSKLQTCSQLAPISHVDQPDDEWCLLTTYFFLIFVFP